LLQTRIKFPLKDNKINRFSLGVPPPAEPIARNSNFQAHVLPVITANNRYTCIITDEKRDFKSISL